MAPEDSESATDGLDTISDSKPVLNVNMMLYIGASVLILMLLSTMIIVIVWKKRRRKCTTTNHAETKNSCTRNDGSALVGAGNIAPTLPVHVEELREIIQNARKVGLKQVDNTSDNVSSVADDHSRSDHENKDQEDKDEGVLCALPLQKGGGNIRAKTLNRQDNAATSSGTGETHKPQPILKTKCATLSGDHRTPSKVIETITNDHSDDEDVVYAVSTKQGGGHVRFKPTGIATKISMECDAKRDSLENANEGDKDREYVEGLYADVKERCKEKERGKKNASKNFEALYADVKEACEEKTTGEVDVRENVEGLYADVKESCNEKATGEGDVRENVEAFNADVKERCDEKGNGEENFRANVEGLTYADIHFSDGAQSSEIIADSENTLYADVCS